jgi:glycosyltransferase involved in cell wall biosynthesis
MHIAMILCNPFRPDPRALKEAEGLAERGHQITLVCWDRAAEMKAEETLASGVRVLRVQTVASGYGVGARQLLRFPRFWRAAFSMLDRLQPDVVHCHGFDALPPGLLWGRLHRRPVVLDAYEYYAELVRPRLHGPGGALLYRLIHQAESVGARLASAVVTVDDTLGDIYRRANRRVVIIGHYPRRALAAEAAPVFTRPDLSLLYIGRLSVDRGILVYADILRRLRKQGIPARLRLVGVFTPASEEQPLRERLRGLEEAADIVPWVPYDQIAAVLRGADVGLVLLQPEPRYVAALPVKLFEYMAAGLPVVANDYPLVAAIVRETRCGALVDPTDAQAAAEIIRQWWKHPDQARAAGENGRQAILGKYNWEAIMERLAELYASLAKRAG